MKNQLKEYIDLIFTDAERRSPGNLRVAELKEEILQNLYEKYDDLIAKGKTPTAAYNIAVAGVGDISGLLDSVSGEDDHTESAGGADSEKKESAKTAKKGRRPLTPEEREQVARYQKRSAVLSAISTALYILCWVPLVVLGALLNDVGGSVGLGIMFLMIALATSLNVYNRKSKPVIDGNADWDEDDCNDDDGDDDEDANDTDDEVGGKGADKDGKRRPRSRWYALVSGIIWTVTLCAYFAVSFATHAWHATWLLFIMGIAADNVAEGIFDLRR